MPKSIQIVAITGKGEQVIFQVQASSRLLSDLHPPFLPRHQLQRQFRHRLLASAMPIRCLRSKPPTGSVHGYVNKLPVSWSWDFGDGGTSTTRSPLYTYTTAGTYTVTLTATNAGGSNTVTRSSYITVNPRPRLHPLQERPFQVLHHSPLRSLIHQRMIQRNGTVSFRNITSRQ